MFDRCSTLDGTSYHYRPWLELKPVRISSRLPYTSTESANFQVVLQCVVLHPITAKLHAQPVRIQQKISILFHGRAYSALDYISGESIVLNCSEYSRLLETPCPRVVVLDLTIGKHNLGFDKLKHRGITVFIFFVASFLVSTSHTPTSFLQHWTIQDKIPQRRAEYFHSPTFDIISQGFCSRALQ